MSKKEAIIYCLIISLCCLLLGILIGVNMIRIGRIITTDSTHSYIISCYEENR